MNVKVYSTPGCPWCDAAKEFLKEHQIEFEDIDVSVNEAEAQKMIEKSGQMGVPVIEVGEKMILGFDKPQLEAALGISSDQ